MEIKMIIGVSLPFIMSYAIQVLKFGMKPLAKNTLKTLIPENASIDGWPKEIAIRLALHFYYQFSFFTSLMLAAASALAFTLISNNKFEAVIVTFVILIALGFWGFRWQPLARDSKSTHHHRLDNEMTIASIIATSIMLVLSILVI